MGLEAPHKSSASLARDDRENLGQFHNDVASDGRFEVKVSGVS
jgi:stress response protein YsnF